ncbi:MAG TPA: hypothetical protein DDY14_05695 [Chromatiaceae bacterium]|nr:MAG: hypothetical protein N838_31355 [Thiohalocapsa sp. PB-PSB1]HBG94812.1 hypothetical protein [Chromatiaceae bacterium]
MDVPPSPKYQLHDALLAVYDIDETIFDAIEPAVAGENWTHRYSGRAECLSETRDGTLEIRVDIP